MNPAHSTAAGYVRDFETYRAEIAESLAADLLVHTVAALQHPDPDLHAQHINAARELRLLVNSLDQVDRPPPETPPSPCHGAGSRRPQDHRGHRRTPRDHA